MIHPYDDPLAFLSPYVDVYVRPSLTKPDGSVYGARLVDNLHTVCFAVAFYAAVYHVSKLFLLSSSVRAHLATPKALKDFSIRTVSLIQASLICVLGVPIFGEKHLAQDHLFSTIPYSGFYASMALGYFMFDLIICLRYVRFFGPGFALHGLVSTVVFSLGILTGFIHYYSAAFLMFELSTPFLDLRWFGLKFGESVFPPWFQMANNVLLLLTFFAARILWGGYQFYSLASDFYAARNDPRFSLPGAAIVLACGAVIELLSVYWLGKMLTVVGATVRKMMGKGADEDKLKIM